MKMTLDDKGGENKSRGLGLGPQVPSQVPENPEILAISEAFFQWKTTLKNSFLGS